MDGSKLRQHRFPPTPSSGASTGPSGAHLYGLNPAASRQTPHEDPSSTVGQVRPFTFDPLFVEDPLSPSNNVGSKLSGPFESTSDLLHGYMKKEGGIL